MSTKTSQRGRFALGDSVVFTDTVAKAAKDDIVHYPSAGVPKGVGRGVVVGARTLFDYGASLETEYGEYGAYLGSWWNIGPCAGTARRAWLVSYNTRRKPVLVLDEHLEAAAPDVANAPPGKQRFALGEPVSFSGTVAKDWEYDGEDGGDGKIVWTEQDLPGDYRKRDAPPYSTGIIVGARTLTDYEFRTEPFAGDPLIEGALLSRPDVTRPVSIKGTARRAWLVSFNLYRKPVLVLDEQVSALEQTVGVAA